MFHWRPPAPPTHTHTPPAHHLVFRQSRPVPNLARIARDSITCDSVIASDSTRFAMAPYNVGKYCRSRLPGHGNLKKSRGFQRDRHVSSRIVEVCSAKGRSYGVVRESWVGAWLANGRLNNCVRLEFGAHLGRCPLDFLEKYCCFRL